MGNFWPLMTSRGRQIQVTKKGAWTNNIGNKTISHFSINHTSISINPNLHGGGAYMPPPPVVFWSWNPCCCFDWAEIFLLFPYGSWASERKFRCDWIMASLTNKAFLRPGCIGIRFFSIVRLQLAKYCRISAWNGLELCAVFLHTYSIALNSPKSNIGPHIGLDIGLKAINLLLSHSTLNILYLLMVFHYKMILYHPHSPYVRYLGLHGVLMFVGWPREAHFSAWITKIGFEA